MSEVQGSAEGNRHSRPIVETHLLHAPGSLSPKALQPRDPSQSGSRDVMPPQLTMAWGEQSQHFILFLFLIYYLN